MTMQKLKIFFILCIVISGYIYSPIAISDGTFVDKVYHPYVQPNEREIEWRWNIQKDSGNSEGERLKDNAQIHRVGYGQSLNEHWFGEIYLIGERNRDDDLDISAVELEALWQITEQGEYDEDWGLLFEVEHEKDSHVSEISSGLS